MTVEEIEDIAGGFSGDNVRTTSERTKVVMAKLKRQYREDKVDVESVDIQQSTELTDKKTEDDDYFLPGKASIFVKTWGCGHNNSDGEYMAGLLVAQGYTVILDEASKDSADLWLLNSCTVKGPSEQTFVNAILKAQDQGKSVVVAGCVPQASPRGGFWQKLSVIGVQQIGQVVEVVEETLKGNTVRLMGPAKTKDSDGASSRRAGGAPLNLPKVRRNPYIEIIPINTGCLNQCTYCKTKHARGDLGSYGPQEIISRVKAVLSEDVKEIWLTSEDVGAYGLDIDTNIIVLLKGIVEAMEGHSNQAAMLRVGMTNPPYILDHLEAMAVILAHPRVYSFLHVPVQAGSNRVLNDMRRQYAREDFKRVIDYLNEHVPGITIATDIICGFPTETDEDFDETISLLDEYRFPILHISQFYPRPGTPAARLQRLSTLVVKDRSRRVTKLFDGVMPYTGLEGQVLRVLVTDLSSSGDQYVAHDKYYRQVLVPKIPQIMGTWVKVTVESTGKYFIIGSLMDDDLSQAATGPAGQLESDPKVPRLIRGQRGLVRATASDKEAHDGTAFSAPTPSSSSDVTPTTPSRWTAPRWLLTTSFIVAYTGLILMTDVRRSVKFGATVGLGFLLHSQYDTQKR